MWRIFILRLLPVYARSDIDFKTVRYLNDAKSSLNSSREDGCWSVDRGGSSDASLRRHAGVTSPRTGPGISANSIFSKMQSQPGQSASMSKKCSTRPIWHLITINWLWCANIFMHWKVHHRKQSRSTCLSRLWSVWLCKDLLINFWKFVPCKICEFVNGNNIDKHTCATDLSLTYMRRLWRQRLPNSSCNANISKRFRFMFSRITMWDRWLSESII